MIIRYEVTADDWIAVERSRWDRSQARRDRLVGGPWQLLLTAVIVFVMAAPVVGIMAAVGLVVFVCGLIARFRWALTRLAFRPNARFWDRYKELLPREAVGRHQLELTEEDLLEKTPYSVRRIPLEDIKEVDSLGDQTFLHTEPGRGCVIPHQALTEGNVETFVEAVRMRVADISAEPLSVPPAVRRGQ